MPRKPTAKGFPCSPEDCYTNRHLEPNLFKMYDTMMAFAKAGQKSRGHNRLECTAAVRPTLCNAYPCAESTAHVLIDKLCELGWLIEHDGGRDKRTGKKLPNTYEMLEHTEFVVKNPGSCPDYVFAPDYESGEPFGLRRGDRRKQEHLPRNFWKPDTRLGDIDPATDMSTAATEAFGLALAEVWNSLPEDERQRRLTAVAEAGEAHRLRNLGEGPSPEVRRPTVSEDSAGPSPRSREDRLRGLVKTVSESSERILEVAILEEADSETTTTTTTGTATPEAGVAARLPWLSWLWSATGEFIDEEKGGGKDRVLRLRKDNKDLIAIEKLIQQEPQEENGVVLLAWAWFASADPPLYRSDTIFPVTVFLDHFDQYRQLVLAEAKRIQQSRAAGNDPDRVACGFHWGRIWKHHKTDSVTASG